jgi:hypothetical protein
MQLFLRSIAEGKVAVENGAGGQKWMVIVPRHGLSQNHIGPHQRACSVRSAEFAGRHGVITFRCI